MGYEQFDSELTAYFYSLGTFSSMHMIVIVSALLYNQYFNFAVYVAGIILNTLLIDIVGDSKPKNSAKHSNFGHGHSVFFSVVYLYYTIHYFMPWTFIGLLLAGATIYEQWALHNQSLVQLFRGVFVSAGFAYIIVYVRDQYLSKYVHN